MHVGGYILDSRQNLLRSNTGEVSLSPLGARFLELMGREPGTVVARTTLIDALWRGDWLVGNAALNRLVSEVRRALGDDPRNPKLIQTVPRCGYRLIVEAKATDQATTPLLTDEGHRTANLPALAVERPLGAVPEPRSETMTWREVWRMANYTVLALGGSVSVIITVGMLAHR